MQGSARSHLHTYEERQYRTRLPRALMDRHQRSGHYTQMQELTGRAATAAVDLFLRAVVMAGHRHTDVNDFGAVGRADGEQSRELQHGVGGEGVRALIACGEQGEAGGEGEEGRGENRIYSSTLSHGSRSYHRSSTTDSTCYSSASVAGTAVIPCVVQIY